MFSLAQPFSDPVSFPSLPARICWLGGRANARPVRRRSRSAHLRRSHAHRAPVRRVRCPALLVAGCESDGSDQGGVVLVGLITKFQTGFYDDIIEGANDYAVAHPRVRVLFGQSESATDDAGQVKLIESMVARGVQAIAITPTSPNVRPALQKAVDAGIKVVLLDNDIPEWHGKTSVVATDNLAGGKLAGQFLASRLAPGATLAILQGRPDNPSLDDRVKGVKTVLGNRATVVAEPVTECDEAKGYSAAKAVLAAHPDVSAIYAACGPPAIGAIRAIKDAGRRAGDIVVVGFDASPQELAAIAAGAEDGSVIQFPTQMGTLGIQTADVAAQGYNVSRNVDTGSEMVTRSNVSIWFR